MEIRKNPPVAVINPPVPVINPATVWDDDYTGNRWKYGLSSRPFSTFSAPEGYILKSVRPHPDYRFGTVDYTRKLTPEEEKHFSMRLVTTLNNPAPHDREAEWNADIEELVGLYNDVTTSDLQGIAEASAMKYVDGGARNYRGVLEVADEMLEEVYERIAVSNPKVKDIDLSDDEYYAFVEYLNENDIQEFTRDDVSNFLQYYHTEYAENPPTGPKFTFNASVKGKPVSFTAKAITLGSEAPSPVRIAPNGQRVKQVQYDKETGDVIPPGILGKKYVDEEGHDVDTFEYAMEDETGAISKRVKEFQKSDSVAIDKFLPRSALDDYLVEKQSEITPSSDTDLVGMWELADYLNENDLIAVSIVVPKKGFDKFGFIIVPYIDGQRNKFTLIGNWVRDKVTNFEGFEIPAGGAKGAEEIDTGVEGLF